MKNLKNSNRMLGWGISDVTMDPWNICSIMKWHHVEPKAFIEIFRYHIWKLG
jgi:hypothetical protein